MRLVSRVLSTFASDERHTAENLRDFLLKVTDSWEITKKIVACVTDNGANIVAAVRLITQWRHVPCFAHTLQLCIKDAWRLNTAIEPLLVKCRNIVSFFHRSNVATAKLRQLCTGPTTKLQPDVETRWNSTFLMVKSLLLLEVVASFSLGFPFLLVN